MSTLVLRHSFGPVHQSDTGIGMEEARGQQCRRWLRRGRIANFDSDQTDTPVDSSSVGMRCLGGLQGERQVGKCGRRREGLAARLSLGRAGRIGIDRYPFWSG